jgi:hypothetical protein
VRSVSKAAQQAQCSRPVEPGLLSQGRVSPGGISRAADWERWAVSLKSAKRKPGKKRKALYGSGCGWRVKAAYSVPGVGGLEWAEKITPGLACFGQRGFCCKAGFPPVVSVGRLIGSVGLFR